MSKSMDSKKQTKKQPTKTMKEKRDAKKAKKEPFPGDKLPEPEPVPG